MSDDATPAPMPFALDNYRLLGRSGLRVSPLALGTMTFGTEWGWGSEADVARRVLDIYMERGGNFIDTANYYTKGTSEEMLGEFLKGRRDQVALATKYTLNMQPADAEKGVRGNPNAGGNARKNMMESVEASLRRLKTDYIDLYWVHMWEFRTPVEEVMRAFDDLVRQGKVLYIGASDTPAWKIAEANTLARLRGWTPFTAMQMKYNLIERTTEFDLVPMALELGIGHTPWAPLEAGLLTGKYGREDMGRDPESADGGTRGKGALRKLTERNVAIIEELVAVAKEIDRSPAQVAINWLLCKPGVTAPILGARTVEQLEDNLGATEFVLTPDQVARLDKVSTPEAIFPYKFLNNGGVEKIIEGGTTIAGGEYLTYGLPTGHR